MGVAELVGSLRIVECQLLLLLPLSHADGITESATERDAIRGYEIARTLLQDLRLEGAAQELIILALKSLFLYLRIIFLLLLIQTRCHIP